MKEIEENMQLKLYNKLYNAREMTDLLSEPESIAERRKELNDMIKVMRNAQKIIRRDPDLMTVMQININDSDISNTGNNTNIKEKEHKDKNENHHQENKIESKTKSEPIKPSPALNKNKSKGNYTNLFG